MSTTGPSGSGLPTFSLVLATVGAGDGLVALLDSLEKQKCRAFELIVVDQNDDDRLVALLARYQSFPIVHMRHRRGLSRSRNAGLARACGAIVAFPDDDCIYDDETLARFDAAFRTHRHAAAICGRARAGAGERPPARFLERATRIAPAQAFLAGISCTIFVRRDALVRAGGFDERLGLGAGTRWTAAEESEMLMRLAGRGEEVRYDPSLTVAHPGHRGPYDDRACARGHAYARAMGFVYRLHGLGVARLLPTLVRPVVGALLATARGERDRARFHLVVARARAIGWREGRGATPLQDDRLRASSLAADACDFEEVIQR